MNLSFSQGFLFFIFLNKHANGAFQLEMLQTFFLCTDVDLPQIFFIHMNQQEEDVSSAGPDVRI